MKKLTKREAGQSIVIVAFALITLVALMALVVDAGNAYVQERKFSNAIDSGSQAGAIAIAQNKTDSQVGGAINQYLLQNGITNTSSVQSYYVVQDGQQGHNFVSNTLVGTQSYVITQTYANGKLLPIVGVQTQGTKSFPTYLAGIVGWKQMQVGGGAASYAMCGAKSSSNLFPIALSNTTFVDTNHNGIGDINDMVLTNSYQVYESGSQTGKFAYVTWNNDTSHATLVDRMGDLKSGPLVAGDSLLPVSVTMYGSNNQDVLAELQSLQSSGTAVNIPVYDTISGGKYHIVGFTRIKITGVNNSSTAANRYISVKFQIWVDPTGTGTAPDFGVCSVKTSQTDISREAIFTIYYRPVYPNQTSKTFYHADVVNVLDTSGSMSASFGSKSKIEAAKSALTSFNTNLQTGDQTSLVNFPVMNGSTSYQYSCNGGGSYSTYYKGTQDISLTGNFTTTNQYISNPSNLQPNGGTPLAGGLKQGLQTVLGAGQHNSNNLPVVILATDGIANIRLDGTWTGFPGDTYSSPDCNAGSVSDAIDQANIAKSDPDHNGVPQAIIFTIAVGDDFNPDVLQAIASPNTNQSPQHYFRATDATSMQNIYGQISALVQSIGSNTCYPSYGLVPVPVPSGTAVTLQAPDGAISHLTANAAGEVIVTNPQVGNYKLQSASFTDNTGMTYGTLTQEFGGPVWGTNQYPILTVGQVEQPYSTDAYLVNSTQITCH